MADCLPHLADCLPHLADCIAHQVRPIVALEMLITSLIIADCMLITSDCVPHQGIATRASARCVSSMLNVAHLPADTFAPVLTRQDPYPDKPHPAIARAACEVWGLRPDE